MQRSYKEVGTECFGWKGISPLQRRRLKKAETETDQALSRCQWKKRQECAIKEPAQPEDKRTVSK